MPRGLQQRLAALVTQHIVREPATGKIVTYSPETLMGTWGVLCELGASVLRSRTIVQTCLGVFATASASAVMAYRNSHPDEGLLVGFEGLEDAIHAMIIFLLGLFLAEVIGGWKAMLVDDEGGLTGAIDEVCLLTAAHFPGDAELQARVLRWGLLSHALLFANAQNRGAGSALDELSRRDLVTPAERNSFLEAGSVDARLPWAWMMRTFSDRAALSPSSSSSSSPTATATATATPLPFPQNSLQTLHQTCLKGVGCIGNALCHVDGKLPFKYVHLLTFSKFKTRKLASRLSWLHLR